MKIKWSSFALNAMFNTLDYVEEHFGRLTFGICGATQISLQKEFQNTDRIFREKYYLCAS